MKRLNKIKILMTYLFNTLFTNVHHIKRILFDSNPSLIKCHLKNTNLHSQLINLYLEKYFYKLEKNKYKFVVNRASQLLSIIVKHFYIFVEQNIQSDGPTGFKRYPTKIFIDIFPYGLIGVLQKSTCFCSDNGKLLS